MGSKEWTEEEIAFIERYYREASYKEMGEAIGRSASAVANRCRKLGLIKAPKRPETPEGFKYCPRCERVLALSEFNKNRSRPNGIGDYCRKCKAQLDQEYEAKKRSGPPEEILRIKRAREETAKGTKTCSACGEEKSASEFGFDQNSLKRANQCNRCKSEKSRANKMKRIIEGRDW